MKAICRRLRRLEQRVALHADAVSRSAAELLRERRRCRLEAGGQQYEELPWHTYRCRRAGASRSRRPCASGASWHTSQQRAGPGAGRNTYRYSLLTPFSR
jgi:hypothetical protein